MKTITSSVRISPLWIERNIEAPCCLFQSACITLEKKPNIIQWKPKNKANLFVHRVSLTKLARSSMQVLCTLMSFAHLLTERRLGDKIVFHCFTPLRSCSQVHTHLKKTHKKPTKNIKHQMIFFYTAHVFLALILRWLHFGSASPLDYLSKKEKKLRHRFSTPAPLISSRKKPCCLHRPSKWQRVLCTQVLLCQETLLTRLAKFGFWLASFSLLPEKLGWETFQMDRTAKVGCKMSSLAGSCCIFDLHSL